MASTLVNLLSGGLLDGVSKVINSIRGKSPEDAAKLEEIKAKYESDFLNVQAELEKARMAENVALNQTAGSNIQAEAKGDWFSRDARPAVIWIGLMILAWNYMVIPVMGIKWHIVPVNFPDLFWEIWGIVSTGYVFARTGDKLFGGAGGSLSLPFGIKADSKGDN